MNVTIQDIVKSNDLSIGTVSSKKNNSLFKDFYNAALEMVNETNTLTKNAENMSVDFALGRIENISDVQIAQEKASIALQYTIQVRDTVLEAYNQIMRMQV